HTEEPLHVANGLLRIRSEVAVDDSDVRSLSEVVRENGLGTLDVLAGAATLDRADVDVQGELLSWWEWIGWGIDDHRRRSGRGMNDRRKSCQLLLNGSSVMNGIGVELQMEPQCPRLTHLTAWLLMLPAVFTTTTRERRTPDQRTPVVVDRLEAGLLAGGDQPRDDLGLA